MVATGRDDNAHREVADLGADTVINTNVPDDDLVHTCATEAGDGYDIVLDVLWGRPTELLLNALVPIRIGQGMPTRLIESATLTLAADSIRTSGLEIHGVAKGLDGQTVADAYSQIVQWARDGRLIVAIERPHSAMQSAAYSPFEDTERAPARVAAVQARGSMGARGARPDASGGPRSLPSLPSGRSCRRGPLQPGRSRVSYRR